MLVNKHMQVNKYVLLELLLKNIFWFYIFNAQLGFLNPD